MNDYKNTSNNSATRQHDEAKRENRDPISGTPGAHPVGTGLGGASGAVAGAVAGTAVGGPVGTVVGAVVGAVAGGLVGKGVGEAVNPTEEDAYWRGHYHQEAYYEKGRNYDDYAPAYQTGYQSRAEHKGQSFEQAERDLERRYDRSRGNSALAWEQARPATRAAWDRAARGASV